MFRSNESLPFSPSRTRNFWRCPSGNSCGSLAPCTTQRRLSTTPLSHPVCHLVCSTKLAGADLPSLTVRRPGVLASQAALASTSKVLNPETVGAKAAGLEGYIGRQDWIFKLLPTNSLSSR
jgi:hypothetical protein